MKITDALEFEKNRQEKEKLGLILLNKDGKFYHAYEWSAYLIKNFICTEDFQRQRGDEKILNASRYKTKNNEYVMLGFPLESISKYIVDYNGAESVTDGDLTFQIQVQEDWSYETMLASFNEWKKSCAEKETKQNIRNRSVSAQESAYLGRSGLFHIVSQVLSYPVENSTPAENIAFISNLRQQVSALL